MSTESTLHVPTNPVRIVTAGSLFDGHDAAINIMRRLLQSQGAEVIHLGHDRSVAEVVTAAIQEDAQGVAVSSYQGGHVEYFTYLRELLDEKGAGHVRVYGGGGGTIVPAEIELLHSRGIDRIFSPGDGQELGLPGMINQIIRTCDVSLSDGDEPSADAVQTGDETAIGRLITRLQDGQVPAWLGEAAAAPHGAGPGHHRHGRRRQVLADRRAGPSHPAGPRGQAARGRPGDRPLPSSWRRCAAG